MYDKLTGNFKNKLIDRRIDLLIILSFSILLLIYIIFLAIIWSIYKHWSILISSFLVFILLCIIIAYLIIFVITKKKNGFRAKEFFHFKRVFNSLKYVLEKDVQILYPLIIACGIDTRPKVQEAIKHYQTLLLRKAHNGFAIISILSFTVSTFGIILSAVNIRSNQELIAILITLFFLLFCVTLICILIKTIYRSIYYNLSEYALYERIEAALSEIWMKDLI